MLISPRYDRPCEPMLAMTFPLESRGCSAALRLVSYSSSKFSGKRDSPVFNWLFKMESAYSYPDRKCRCPFASTTVALVIPLEEMAQGGTLDKPEPVAQPGPSPGIGMGGLPLVVACVANAEAFKMASGKPQSISVTDGVVVRGPNWKVADTLPPRAKESSPFATSL